MSFSLAGDTDDDKWIDFIFATIPVFHFPIGKAACSLNALFVQANNSSMFDNPIIQMRKEKDVVRESLSKSPVVGE